MQTFLPFPDFAASMAVLDSKRLGKQRVECVQILNALKGLSKGWTNHPCTKMWRGYEDALTEYLWHCVQAWIARGYNNNIEVVRPSVWVAPHWLGDPEFHASHRSNLLRKMPEHYSKFEWKEPDNLPYKWPA